MLSRLIYRRLYSSMAPITVKTAANDFLSFVDASPTPFHAVKSVKERLTKAGFKEIKVRVLASSPYSMTLTVSRREILGHLRATPVENTILLAILALSSLLPLARNGSLATPSP